MDLSNVQARPHGDPGNSTNSTTPPPGLPVQNIPLYNVGSTGEFVKSLSDGGWNNLIMTVKFKPEHVSHFVTTFSNRNQLKDGLPEDYKNKKVYWTIYI